MKSNHTVNCIIYTFFLPKGKSRKQPRLAKDIWETDKKITAKLEELGYVVLRFWHSELETNREKCIKKIQSAIRSNSRRLQ